MAYLGKKAQRQPPLPSLPQKWLRVRMIRYDDISWMDHWPSQGMVPVAGTSRVTRDQKMMVSRTRTPQRSAEKMKVTKIRSPLPTDSTS